jgi:hypothetical protein
MRLGSCIPESWIRHASGWNNMSSVSVREHVHAELKLVSRPALLVVLGAVLLVGTSCRKSPTDNGGDGTQPVVSRFLANDEGWTAVGDGILYYAPAGGNPGTTGYIFIVDRAEGDNFYFNAPARFRGNKAGAFGRNLNFDLTWSETEASDYKDAPDIIITGAGITITTQLPEVPSTSWTRYSIPLDTRGGWARSDSGAAATATEILNVLGNITQFRIRGEFRSGPERGGLDNVELGAEPL